MKFDRKVVKGFSMITQLGVTIVVTLFMSIFIGIWLDKLFKLGYFFTILFIIIGIGASFRNLYKLSISNIDKKEKKYDKNSK